MFDAVSTGVTRHEDEMRVTPFFCKKCMIFFSKSKTLRKAVSKFPYSVDSSCVQAYLTAQAGVLPQSITGNTWHTTQKSRFHFHLIKEKKDKNMNDSHLNVSAWRIWQLAWCSNWSSSHRKLWQKEQRKILPPAQKSPWIMFRMSRLDGRKCKGQRLPTVIPNSSVTLDALGISEGTCTGVGAQTFPAVAHPGFTEVTHCPLVVKKKTEQIVIWPYLKQFCDLFNVYLKKNTSTSILRDAHNCTITVELLKTKKRELQQILFAHTTYNTSNVIQTKCHTCFIYFLGHNTNILWKATTIHCWTLFFMYKLVTLSALLEQCSNTLEFVEFATDYSTFFWFKSDLSDQCLFV